MDSRSCLIILILGLSYYVTVPVNGLECYICNSLKSSSCSKTDDLKKDYLVDCNTKDPKFVGLLPALPPGKNWTLCRKMVIKVDFDVNENEKGERVVRTCGWDDTEEDRNNECKRSRGYGADTMVCTCDKGEGCNSSTTLKYSTLVFSLALTTIILVTN